MDDYLTKPIRCEALEERVLYLSVHFLFANFLSRKKKKKAKNFLRGKEGDLIAVMFIN